MNLQVIVGSTVVGNTTLPTNLTNDGWVEQIVTIPTGATTMRTGIAWGATVAAGEIFYLNEFEITKLTVTEPEYQYSLKDHLGNVRLTFTTKQEELADTATYEETNKNKERGQFLRYDNAKRVYSPLFDHTNGADGYAQRLGGNTNEVYGLAKSLSVMPGDVVNMEVFAKYIDAQTSNHTPQLTALLSQVVTNTAGVVYYDGVGYAASTSSFPFGAGLNGTASSSGTGPKAYLNWLVFNKDYVLIPGKSGYKRMTTAAREYGQNAAHELLNGSINIDEPGYVYIYLSNEEGANPYEVYFDDFMVEHVKSPVIQTDDYYPFGLTFNSFNRENALFNQFQYNGKEKQDELGLEWLDYGWRMYQPDLGRFYSKDPNADNYYTWTPYNYVGNNPTLLIDPDGRDWDINKTEDKEKGKTHYDIKFTAAIVNESKNMSADDLVTLTWSLMDQVESSFTIDEGKVSTSVIATIRFAHDGETKDNEHVIRVTDDLPSDVLGDADLGGRDIRINSSEVALINKRENTGGHDQHGNPYDDRDKMTGPHEVGHTAGLTHPDERTVWYDPSTWFLPSNQYIAPGQQKNNLMYNGYYRDKVLKQDFSNGGKGYKINANQARIMYENRDNKEED